MQTDSKDPYVLSDEEALDTPQESDEVISKSPSEKLAPGTALHGRVLRHLLDRLDLSERKMQQFYARWTYNEKRIQAYIDLPNWEAELKKMNDAGKVPSAVRIVVPYSYATISTIVTYLAQVFFGQKPLLSVTTYKPENIKASRLMETVLQHQADRNKLVSVLYQFLQDTQYYNLGILKCAWTEERALRTVWKRPQMGPIPLGNPMAAKVPSREERLVYQGNDVETVDPFMFFPDPRVPMSQVNRKGEFVFWRTFSGRHELKTQELAGNFHHTDSVGSLPRQDYAEISSDRSLTAGGDGHPGQSGNEQHSIKDFVQLDEGSVIIIPKELGLGDSERPEHWIFTVANKQQIIRAAPLNLDHGMHPVAVSEPYGGGYGFGHAGITDMMGPLQDLMSWLVDSHIANVRGVLNNMFVVDPSRIEMQDLENMGPAKHIRLKRAALGQDVRGALQQLQVQDVTRSHIQDLQVVLQMADALTGVSDNLRGLQAAGGRKTATEVRTTSEAGSSRLAALARIISAQGMVDLTTQMSVNTQQLLSEEMYVAVTGEDGKQNPLRVTAEHVAGDFSFPVNDGTLPVDRVAMLDVWKEIFMGISQDPELSQSFDRRSIFKHIAELGGAKNITEFEIQVQPDAQVQAGVADGTLAPVNPNVGQPRGQTPGVSGNPGDRLAGAGTS